ncbi:hypothetical protein BH09VER1_BH09VER1_17560 [soil metagenome]
MNTSAALPAGAWEVGAFVPGSRSTLFDAYYDEAACLVRVPFESPGYHSRVPTGTLVHPTNTSLCYALDLLHRGRAECDARAFAIMRKIIPLQDRDPVSPSYGIWSWLYEEPIAQMDPPDWNWADFCGFRLAQIITLAGPRLPADLLALARESLYHAAGCIYRRNVLPHYTNICVMGGLVTTMAGEILQEERLLAYGRRRLAHAAETHRNHGGFNEYNSPTYTRVVLWDCEQALDLIRDEAARASALYLFRSAWQVVASHFHPATGQWAGPHCRDYTSFLVREMALYLAFKTGVKIRVSPLAPLTTRVSPLIGWAVEAHGSPNATAPESFSAVHFNPRGLRCPADLIERFRALPSAEYEFRERYVLREKKSDSIWGTTWMHEEACLGSVNHDSFMDQRRVLLGYWNAPSGAPGALRLRFLRDDREFAAAHVHNAQSGTRILSAAHLVLGHGPFNPYLEIPPGDIFSAEDFRLRYELRGDDVTARKIPGGFALSSGAWEAAITTAEGSFNHQPIAWQITEGDGWVAVDAICYFGPRRDFPFRELPPLALASALHLRRTGEESEPSPVELEYHPAEKTISARWQSHQLTVPDHAITLPKS